MRWFKRPDFDVEKSLKVKFLGESGVDFGGPRRECLQKVVTGLAQSGIFQGEVGYLLPSPNIAKLADKSVYNAGRMVSTVICHSGPAPRMFHHFLVDYICGKAVPKAGDIPQSDIRAVVMKVNLWHVIISLAKLWGIEEFNFGKNSHNTKVVSQNWYNIYYVYQGNFLALSKSKSSPSVEQGEKCDQVINSINHMLCVRE